MSWSGLTFRAMRTIQRRNSRDGFVLLVLVATLQVLIVTRSIFATSIMFLGAAMVSVIGYVWVVKGESDSKPEPDDEQWIGHRWSTMLGFLFMFASGTLRALDITGWIWIPVAVIAIGVTAASVIWHRRRG